MVKLIYFCLISLYMFCSSCKTKYIEHFSVVERDTTVYLPGRTVYDTINFKDTVFFNTFNERTIVDSTGRAELKWYKDELGRLMVRCTAKQETVMIPVKEYKTIKVPVNQVSNEPKNNNWLLYLIIGVGSFIILLVIIKQIFK